MIKPPISALPADLYVGRRLYSRRMTLKNRNEDAEAGLLPLPAKVLLRRGRKVSVVLFSVAEVDFLRLIRWCRYLPCEETADLFTTDTVNTLLHFKLIVPCRGRGLYALTRAGDRFLDTHMPDMLPAAVRPAYREKDILRRERIARFTLAAYRAGLSVFQRSLAALDSEGACYLIAQARTQGKNPWGSTRVAAIAHLGKRICAVHYVGENVGGIAYSDELGAFRNNTAKLKETGRGMIFTGESYEEIFTELRREGDGTQTLFTSYREAYRRLAYPVFLIPSNEIGARQMHMMLQPDYRRYMTAAALGTAYQPPPKERPEWDAMFKGTAFLMAADMDLKRIDLAIRRAKRDGLPPVYLVALKGQEKVLLRRYKDNGLAGGVFTFNEKEKVRQATELYVPSDRPFETEKGVVVRAPLIQDTRKAGEQGGKQLGELGSSP